MGNPAIGWPSGSSIHQNSVFSDQDKFLPFQESINPNHTGQKNEEAPPVSTLFFVAGNRITDTSMS